MSNFLEWLGNTELAFQIGATWWFPLLESVHVLAFSLLVGVMLLVDLRLMGSRILTGRARLVVGQLTPWAWSAFAVAAITGSGMSHRGWFVGSRKRGPCRDSRIGTSANRFKSSIVQSPVRPWLQGEGCLDETRINSAPTWVRTPCPTST